MPCRRQGHVASAGSALALPPICRPPQQFLQCFRRCYLFTAMGGPSSAVLLENFEKQIKVLTKRIEKLKTLGATQEKIRTQLNLLRNLPIGILAESVPSETCLPCWSASLQGRRTRDSFSQRTVRCGQNYGPGRHSRRDRASVRRIQHARISFSEPTFVSNTNQ